MKININYDDNMVYFTRAFFFSLTRLQVKLLLISVDVPIGRWKSSKLLEIKY